MSKGIRVNQLAKELRVESKAILARCREEGLADKVPNHMSVLSLGLTETVREWFSKSGGGGVSTAVELAPPAETATKSNTSRKTKRVEVPAPPAAAKPKTAGVAHFLASLLKRSSSKPRASGQVKVQNAGEPAGGPAAKTTHKPTNVLGGSTAQPSDEVKASSPKNDSAHTEKPGEKVRRNEAIKLIKTLQQDFETHLAEAKAAEAISDRKRRDRFVRAAIVSQVAVVDGYISLLFERYFTHRNARKNLEELSKWKKLERLCQLASKYSGIAIIPFQFRLSAFRNVFNHPATSGSLLSATDVNQKLPTPSEVEAEEQGINDFLENLEKLLKQRP